MSNDLQIAELRQRVERLEHGMNRMIGVMEQQMHSILRLIDITAQQHLQLNPPPKLSSAEIMRRLGGKS